MRVFILSAGKGTRLLPLTRDIPKSLLVLRDGESVLQKQLKVFSKFTQIDKITIVTGYRGRQIENFVKGYNMNVNGKHEINTVFNPFFDVSNNLMSLWMARHYMKDKDFIITNGDNIYNERLVKTFLTKSKDKEGIFVTLNERDPNEVDEMRVMIKYKKIHRISKQIPAKKAKAESVGLVKVVGEEARRDFFEVLDQLAYEEEYLNKFWLEIFNRMVEIEKTVRFVMVKKDDWKEVDFHPDIQVLNEYIFDTLTI